MVGSWWRVLTKRGPLEKGMEFPSCLENPINSVKRQKDKTLKDELPRSVGVQYATEDQWRNNLKTELRDGAKAKTTPSCGGDW